MSRPMIRRALRVARAGGKAGASTRDVSPKFGAELGAMGLLREVVVRVAITGAIIERRWKLTAFGHAWLDEDEHGRESVVRAIDRSEAEDTGT